MLMIDLSKHTYLFTVADSVMLDCGMVLSPGAPCLKGAPVVRDGDVLILENRSGDLVRTVVRDMVRDHHLAAGGKVDEGQLGVLWEFRQHNIPPGTKVYLEVPTKAATLAAVVEGASAPPMHAPQGWGMSFFYEKPCCPNCGSTELMFMKRMAPFPFDSHPVNPFPDLPNRGGKGMFMIGFPIGFLILLQSPMLMNCDACGTDFLCRSRHVRIYRLLLVCAVVFYALLLRKCFGM